MLNQEPSPEEPAPDEPAMESLLAGFSPKENAIDRERLMFLAGYEAAKQEYEKASTHVRLANRRWKFLTFVSSAAAAACMAILLIPPSPTSATADRNSDQSSSTGVDAKPVELPKEERTPAQAAVVAMASAREDLPAMLQLGPENGCLRLRDQVLREEGFAQMESKPGAGLEKRLPATQRQLFLELPFEVRGPLSPADKGPGLPGSSRLGERS